ncbi:hypothetical protein DPM33_30345 [Mesorhizobium hawassense]|uniref:Uncharacterized protein n=1 Tax=Mesorhizobium hawassense TaxID=1209954 RepID=A0A330HDV7_9HYPH|nr:hypothetical protein DPM33_30345 [Mesorhizobium hawassense]
MTLATAAAFTVQEFLENDYLTAFWFCTTARSCSKHMNGMEPHFKHVARSGSKSITSTMVGILVHRGIINPESPVTQYLPEELSGILCARPVSSLADEPFAEHDGELGFGLEPLARRSFPFLGRVVEHQI